MKKIYVDAYCNMNLGDDLFVIMLASRYRGSQFYVCCNPHRGGAFKRISNLRITSFAKWWILKGIKKIFRTTGAIEDKKRVNWADAVVKIGGSIFMESDTWLNNWNSYNKPVFIIGANYGPAYSKTFRDLVANKISCIRACCFRDYYSYSEFKDVCNASVAPDVLFGFDVYKYIKKSKNAAGVAISVIALDKRKGLDRYCEQYYSAIAKICDKLIDLSIPVTLLAFCCNEGDSIAIEEIKTRSQYSNKISKVLYEGNIEKMLSAMNACETIIATRFHAMILGWVMKKRVIPIIYSTKQTEVIKDLGYDGSTFDISQIEEMKEIIVEKCMHETSSLKNLQLIIDSSSKQFKELDKFMDEYSQATKNIK